MKECKFKATIQDAGGNGGAYVLFPFDTKAEFGTGAKIPIIASIDGVPYTGSLVKCGLPQHMLPILRNIRQQIDKCPGDTVAVVLRRDEAVRTIEVPPEFSSLMKREGVLATFEKLSYTHRKEYCAMDQRSEKGREASGPDNQGNCNAGNGRKDPPVEVVHLT